MTSMAVRSRCVQGPLMVSLGDDLSETFFLARGQQLFMRV